MNQSTSTGNALTSNLLDLHTPTGREEAWRFTPLDSLQGLHDLSIALTPTSSFELAAIGIGATLSEKSGEAASATNDYITCRVREASASYQSLQISADGEYRLTRTAIGADNSASRLLVTVAPNVHAKLTILNSASTEVSLAEDVEYVLGDGSSLQLIVSNEWSADSVLLSRQHALLGKDSQLTWQVVTVGGKLVRMLPSVEYLASGASAELSGLYFATSGQHLEHRIHIDHNLPHNKSRVNYKGALLGNRARTVWFGDVFIRANAEGTDTYEINRNLLLSDGARADSVPNLEIETGQIVGAGHASTTGRFDDEQLFYLQARGIPADVARQLVLRGFFLEILALLKDEEISERIMLHIESTLEQAR